MIQKSRALLAAPGFFFACGAAAKMGR